MLNNFARIAIVAALALNGTMARADSVFDMIPKLSSPGVTSLKSTDALEDCIGVGISDWLLPGTLRGEAKVLIYGTPNVSFSNQVYILVQIRDLGTSRLVTFHAHKAWDDKTAALIASCAA